MRFIIVLVLGFLIVSIIGVCGSGYSVAAGSDVNKIFTDMAFIGVGAASSLLCVAAIIEVIRRR